MFGCCTIYQLVDRSTTEVVYVATGNPALCLDLYLTGAYFRGELYHVGHVGEQKIKCRPIRTWETAGVRM